MPLAPEPPFSSTRPTSQGSGRGRRAWLVGVKFGILALVIWGVHRTIGRALADLRELAWQPSSLDVGQLLGAGGVYLLALAPAGLFWWRVLHRLGQQPQGFETLRAYYIGHLGKYVPGKALVVILRAALIRSERVDTAVAAAAVFCETLTMMAVGAFVGAAVVLVLFREQWELSLLAIALMLSAGLPTVPAVFVRLARWAGVGRHSPTLNERLAQLDLATLSSGWALNLVGWALVGTSLWLTVQATGFGTAEPSVHEWFVCVGAAALAVVAGFASLIPGGLGVRDAVLLVLLVPTLGQAGALVATIVARLVWLVAEIGISTILYLVPLMFPRVRC